MLQTRSTANPLKILLIEDSKGDAILISKVLQQAMPMTHLLETTTTLKEALKVVAEHEFDVALLDRTLPDTRGFSGLHSIQNISPKLPIIFLTGYKDEYLAFEAIKQGAQDYLFKDQLDAPHIMRAIQYAILRKEFEEVLITRANFDMLTGLANRILFENRLNIALTKMKQLGGMCSILLLDLDKFKEINDSLGHLAGDQLLKEFAHRLKQSLRSYDVAARLGGDEFAILLEDINECEQSEIVAKKIIQLMEVPFNISGELISIDISIGIVNCHEKLEFSSELLLEQADKAMYQAKTIPHSFYCVYGTKLNDESYLRSSSQNKANPAND